MIDVYIIKAKSREVYKVFVEESLSISFSYKSCSTVKFTQPYGSGAVVIREGDVVELRHGDSLIWRGIILDVDSDGGIIASDLLVYLKSKDVNDYSEGITASTLLRDQCATMGIAYQQTDVASYIQKYLTMDNNEVLSVIHEALDEELSKVGRQLILNGHKGFVTLVGQERCVWKETLVIENYKIARSLSSSANHVIVYNKEKTNYGSAMDMESIRYYGMRRLIAISDTADTTQVSTSAQDSNSILSSYAQNLLKLRNTVEVELNLTALGGVEMLGITQGFLIPVKIDEVDKMISVNGYYIVEEVTHKVTNSSVTSSFRVSNSKEAL